MPTAICSPSCQNGGQCISHNVCQCGKEFRGGQCQYSVEVCSPKKIGFNGAYNCSGNSDLLRCSLSCPQGVEFSSPPASEYVCKYEMGEFGPLPIPQCKYSECIGFHSKNDLNVFVLEMNEFQVLTCKSSTAMSNHIHIVCLIEPQ